MAAPWRFGDASWASLVVLVAVAAASAEASYTAQLTFGTTFGNSNVKPNNTYTPPTRPPEASLLVGQPRLEMYTSKLSTSSIKTSDSQKNTTQPPPVRGKDCTKDSHCDGLKNTTCQVDPRDQKKRCLCFDKTGPLYAACTHSRRGPNVPCNTNEECITNALCVGNSSSPISQKQCQCIGDYDEEDHECDSGGMLTLTPACITVTFLFVAYHAWL